MVGHQRDISGSEKQKELFGPRRFLHTGHRYAVSIALFFLGRWSNEPSYAVTHHTFTNLAIGKRNVPVGFTNLTLPFEALDSKFAVDPL